MTPDKSGSLAFSATVVVVVLLLLILLPVLIFAL
jgi:hypothetical protein